jgi:Cu/Ag efflux protein CusF
VTRLELKQLTTGFLLLASAAHVAGGPAATKEITLFARVESIDKTAKTVTVKHGKIAGYVEAVPATYALDDETLISKLRPGDDIRATVREGEHWLRHVRIVNRAPSQRSMPTKQLEKPFCESLLLAVEGSD